MWLSSCPAGHFQFGLNGCEMDWCKKMIASCDPPLTMQQGQDVYDQMKALEFHRGPMTPELLGCALPIAVLFLSSPFFYFLPIGPLYSLLSWLGTIVPSLALVYLHKRRNERRNLIEIGRLLRERGVRVRMCGRCSYDLRAITSDACPECGEPVAAKIKVTVETTAPSHTPG